MPEPTKLSFKIIINDAIGFIAGNWRQMAAISLPLLFLTTLVGAGLARAHQSTFNAFFVPFIFNLLIYPIYTAALIHLMVAKARHIQPTHRQLLLAASRQWAPLFVLKLIMMVMTIAGFMLIIPGLWLWVRLSFAEFYLVVFGDPPHVAIQKSIAATKPFGMLLLAILLFSYIPIVILDLVVDRIIWTLTQNPWLSLISNTLFAFFALFVLVVVFRVFMETISNNSASSSHPSSEKI